MICRDLGLDDSGREKAVLIGRLIGQDGEAAAPGATGKAKKPGEPVPALPAPPASGKLTVEQLERYLWSAADILRGSIDSIGLQELHLRPAVPEAAVRPLRGGVRGARRRGDPTPGATRTSTSSSSRSGRAGRQIQKAATGLGETAQQGVAPRSKRRTPRRSKACSPASTTTTSASSATRRHRDNVLHRLVQHFSKVNLRNDHLSEPDMLGRAYEYLIEKFADDAGKKGGEFYTPHMVVRLIVELLEPKEGMRICDPTVRLGRHADRVRAKYIERARRQPAEPQPVRAGEEPRHLGDLQDEHAAARAARMRASRRATPSATRSCSRAAS